MLFLFFTPAWLCVPTGIGQSRYDSARARGSVVETHTDYSRQKGEPGKKSGFAGIFIFEQPSLELAIPTS